MECGHIEAKANGGERQHPRGGPWPPACWPSRCCRRGLRRGGAGWPSGKSVYCTPHAAWRHCKERGTPAPGQTRRNRALADSSPQFLAMCGRIPFVQIPGTVWPHAESYQRKHNRLCDATSGYPGNEYTNKPGRAAFRHTDFTLLASGPPTRWCMKVTANPPAFVKPKHRVVLSMVHLICLRRRRFLRARLRRKRHRVHCPREAQPLPRRGHD